MAAPRFTSSLSVPIAEWLSVITATLVNTAAMTLAFTVCPIVERDSEGSSPPVGVAASVYMHDLDRSDVFNDAVDHSVVTSASRVQPDKLATKGLADSLWVVRQRPEDELDAGRSDLLWQPLQIAFGSSRDSDRVPLLHSGDPVTGLERLVVGEAACGGVREALIDGLGGARCSEDL